MGLQVHLQQVPTWRLMEYKMQNVRWLSLGLMLMACSGDKDDDKAEDTGTEDSGTTQGSINQTNTEDTEITTDTATTLQTGDTATTTTATEELGTYAGDCTQQGNGTVTAASMELMISLVGSNIDATGSFTIEGYGSGYNWNQTYQLGGGGPFADDTMMLDLATTQPANFQASLTLSGGQLTGTVGRFPNYTYGSPLQLFDCTLDLTN